MRRFQLTADGINLSVAIKGTGEHIRQILYDNEPYPSAVIP